MTISKPLYRSTTVLTLALACFCQDAGAQRGGGGRGGGGGSRSGGSRAPSRSAPPASSARKPSSSAASSRASAARSDGRGTVRHSGSRSATPSRLSEQHAAAFNTRSTGTRPAATPSQKPVSVHGPDAAPKAQAARTTREAVTTYGPSQQPSQRPREVARPTDRSSSSRTGLAVATGAAAGATAATVARNRRETRPEGYGSISQSGRLADPTARKAASERLASDPRAREAAVQSMQASPDARSAAMTAATGAPASRDDARKHLQSSGHAVHTTLPATARPVRINGRHHHHHHYRYRRPYRTYYRHGSYWYRPYYYGGYVYYEETSAPLGAELDALPEEDHEEIVIDGVTYYPYGDVYLVQTDDGYEVVDPYAEALPAEDDGTVAMDPETSRALQVLRGMSDHLETLKNFMVDSIESHDTVQESGERVQLNNARRVFVTKPDKIRTQTEGDGINRQFWYDGSSVTVYSAVLKTYATVPAPDTVPEMVATMSADYGLPFPLADVLFSDVFYALSTGVQTADYVGEHQAGNVMCHHLAFSQDTIDWQIWVEKSSTPVPRKIQISYKLEPGAPVYTMEVVKWKRIAEKAGAYTFKPPADAVEIEMNPL